MMNCGLVAMNGLDFRLNEVVAAHPARNSRVVITSPGSSEPRLRASILRDPLGNQDWRRDTPENVDGQNEHGPVERRAQRRDVAVIEQSLPDVVRIEERLCEEPLLEQRVRCAEQQDGWPAAARTAGDLPNQKRAAAVEGQQRDHERQVPDGEIAEEKLGHDRGEHGEEHCRRNPTDEGHDRARIVAPVRRGQAVPDLPIEAARVRI